MIPCVHKPDELPAITLRKVTRRLIPFLFLLDIVAWLDRVNVGFAALQMNADLGFSSAAFGFGSGGPTLIGVLKDRTGTHDQAFLLLGGFALVASLIAFGLRGAAVLRAPPPAPATARLE